MPNWHSNNKPEIQIDTIRLDIVVCEDCANVEPGDIEAKLRGNCRQSVKHQEF
ncbi:hypothetical protein KAR91_55305 [Candidatus Pacearchaeota archaeon]|nr:hypothetical protein [Candidatus Pacearchaeota archaeon]